MPSTREVRNRIKSLKGTQQITKAMKMVAAAKVRRAQERVVATRPYAEKILEVLQVTAQRLRQEDIQEPLLEKRSKEEKVGFIVISADKGLCGSYNANIIRHALKEIEASEENGLVTKAWLIGNKAVTFFKRAPFEVKGRYSQLSAIPTVAEAQMISDSVVEAFLNKEVDRVMILYTHFVSMLQYSPSSIQLFPIEPPEMQEKIKGDFIYDPDVQTIVQKVLPKYIGNQVYHSLLEASASELASRMTAMDAATKNAEDMLDELTLLYNKVRQTAITNEILEVVGGAAALE